MTAPAALEPSPTRSHLPALGLAVLCGGLVAVQQRLNGDLGHELHDPLLAALISFGSGLVVVGLVVASRPTSRRALPSLRRTPWWSRLGGLGGASLVAAGAFAAPLVGVALLTVALVAGQTVGALLSDRVGVGPGGRLPVSPQRLAGSLVCLVAVAVAVAGDAHVGHPVLLVLVVLAGGLVAVQQGLNGRVRRATGDAMVATLNNFLGGTVALATGFAVYALSAHPAARHWPGLDHVWLYLGGSVGVVFISISAGIVHQLGVLRLTLASTAGQLVGAVLLDLGRGVAAGTLVGVGLTMVAVGISGTAGTRRAGATS